MFKRKDVKINDDYTLLMNELEDNDFDEDNPEYISICNELGFDEDDEDDYDVDDEDDYDVDDDLM